MPRRPTPARPPTLHTRKQDVVRSAIWDAAIDLFAGAGFEKTTVDEIAAAAGVSTRTFFRYFASKNDLMGQGMVRYRAMLVEAIAAAPRGLPPLEVIRFAAEQVVSEAASTPRLREIVQLAMSSPGAREAQLSRRSDLEDGLIAAFAARFSRRGHDELTARLLSGLTLALLDVTFRVWSAGTRPIGTVLGEVFKTLTGVVES